ncbi:MAG: hypothetical protein WD341_07720 [Tistlia sp.]|uniref:hypothetical protein n=1 Tax=Tistlia sp. TaxID=3057121 RepID=UPI0034A20387
MATGSPLTSGKRRHRLLIAAGLLISLGWLVASWLYLRRVYGVDQVASLLPHELGTLVVGVFAPLIFLWLVALVVARARGLSAETAALVEKLDALTYPPDEATARVRAITASLREQSELVRGAADEAGDKLGEVRDELAGQLRRLGEIDQQTSARLEEMRGATDRQIVELNAASEKAQEAAAGILAAVREPVAELADAADRAVGESVAAADRLGERSAELVNVTQQLTSSAGGLRQQLEGDTKAIQTATRDLAQRAKSFNEEARELLEQLTTSFAGAVNQADYLKATLSNQSGDLSRLVEEIERKSSEINHALQGVAELVRSSADDAVSSAGQMGGMFRSEAETAAATAERASEKMRVTMVQARTDLQSMGEASSTALSEAARHATRRLQEASEALRPHVQALSAASERAIERAGQSGEAFQRRAEQLREVTDLTAERIDKATISLQRLAQVLAERAREASESSREASSEMQEQGRALSDLTASAQTAATSLRGAVEEELERLAALTPQLTGTSETVRQLLGEQSRALGQASHEAEASAQEIKLALSGSIADFGQASAGAAARLKELSSHLGQAAVALTQSADGALERARAVGQQFESQGEGFERSVASTIAQLNDVSIACRQQAEELRRASEEASQHTLRLRQSDLEARRDLFLRTATLMLDELTEASVDIAKLVDQEIPDDYWKRWRKGERNIFARRLVRRRDDGMTVELAQRYRDDERFRQRATRYIQQFESLLNQAAECDPENVLSATFLTADVGKLYLLLARAVGRQQ